MRFRISARNAAAIRAGLVIGRSAFQSAGFKISYEVIKMLPTETSQQRLTRRAAIHGSNDLLMRRRPDLRLRMHAMRQMRKSDF